MSKKRLLAIIPARSGSKGLKNKNIMNLLGKPMISYTIEAALESNVFDDVIVSTDSEIYAKIAVDCGASVPFLRSNELSSDIAKTSDVIVDLLNKLELNGIFYDYFMILQPTSPLRSVQDIINSVNLLTKKKATSIVSVSKSDVSPLLMNKLDKTLSLKGFIKSEFRRQDIQDYYRINGAIYLCKTEYYLEHKDFYGSNSFAYIMDKKNAIDVDDEIDFLIAEKILELKK